MHRIFTQKFWHQLFRASVALKAVNSVWETLLGSFMLWINHVPRLSEHAKDFVGIYLLFHGLLNVFLAYNLYKNRLWAYPVSIVTVVLFLTYQVHQLVETHSVILFFITLFDVGYIWLTWHEYVYQRGLAHHRSNTNT